MRRSVIMIVLAIFLLALTAGGIVASSGRSPSDNRKDAVEGRNDAFNRAEAIIPVPQTNNFPKRKELADAITREDMIHHPWYTYILGVNGNIIGYWVSKTQPINDCDFISSTEDIYSNDKGVVKMQSPSLDGIYYGNSVCDVWLMFDAATNAEIKIRGVNWFTSDQPLKLATKPVLFRAG